MRSVDFIIDTKYRTPEVFGMSAYGLEVSATDSGKGDAVAVK